MLNWKNIFKSWTGVPVLILVVLVLVWGIPYLTGKYQTWQLNREYNKLAEPYYNDTYGGATPEETYDLFIQALKNEDTELASKYFVIEKQDDWLKTLGEYYKNNILPDFVDELEKTSEEWARTPESNDSTVSFEYDVFIKKGTTTTIDGQVVEIPEGKYTNESIFEKYPSGVWKISGI